MRTCNHCFFPADFPHDCSGDMGDLQGTRRVIEFTGKQLDEFVTDLREQLAREIEATCNGSGDSEMGGYGKYFANLVRGKR